MGYKVIEDYYMAFKLIILTLCIIFLQSKYGAGQSYKELANEAKLKFEGKWVGISGEDTIEINLVQMRNPLEIEHPRLFADTVAFLFGWYSFKNKQINFKNNFTNLSNEEILKKSNIIFSYTVTTIRVSMGLSLENTNPKIYSGSFTLTGANEGILTGKQNFECINFGTPSTSNNVVPIPPSIQLKRVLIN